MPLIHVSDAMAVVVGVVCGGLASIPFGLLILLLVSGHGAGEKTARGQEVVGPMLLEGGEENSV